MNKSCKEKIITFITINYILLYSILFYLLNYFFGTYLIVIYNTEYQILIHTLINSIFLTIGIKLKNGYSKENNNKNS